MSGEAAVSETLWTLTWRHVTPKGVPGKTEFTTHLSEYELIQLIPKHLSHSCWISAERQDINFRGKSIHREDAVRVV